MICVFRDLPLKSYKNSMEDDFSYHMWKLGFRALLIVRGRKGNEDVKRVSKEFQIQ